MMQKIKGRKLNKFIIFIFVLSVLFQTIHKTNIVSAEILPDIGISKNTRAGEDVCQPIGVTGFNGDIIAEKGELKYDTYYYYYPYKYVSNAIYGYYSLKQQGTTYIYEIHQLFYSLALYDNDYAKKYGTGLPLDGAITSNYNKAQYQLQSYDKNNMLGLTASNKSSTLTFENKDIGSYKKISILAACRITSTVDVTINFTTGSPVTYKDKQIKSWDTKDPTDHAIKGLGRFDTEGWAYTTTSSLYDIELELAESDQKRQIKSISFTYNGTSYNANDVEKPGNGRYQYVKPSVSATSADLAVFAVSGIKGDSVSIPETPLLTNVTNILQKSATLNWNMVSNADEYLVDVATDKNFSSFSTLTNYNNVSTVSNSLNLTGLKPDTTYYFRVRAKNTAGTSASSDVGSFTTLSYTITILKEPQSVIVEANNISEKLSVSAVTTSQKPLIYTWYLNDSNNNLIDKNTTGASYAVPTDLSPGEYTAVCEIYNEEVKSVYTQVVKITVEVIYDFEISWGEMKFDFGPDFSWDPMTHSYTGENTYSWKTNCINGENNKVSISNNSSTELIMSIRYTSKEGAFNAVFDENTSVQGRFYTNNDAAVTSSGYMTDLTEKLAAGKELIEENIGTNKWSASQEVKRFETYFAFSGMPDLSNDDNSAYLNQYRMVGTIQISFQAH